MLLFRSYPLAFSVLIIASISGVGLSPRFTNERPPCSQPISDDAALWLLVKYAWPSELEDEEAPASKSSPR